MFGGMPDYMSNALTAVKGVLSDTSQKLSDAVGGIKKKATDVAQSAVADAKKRAQDAAQSAVAEAKKRAEAQLQDTMEDVKKRAAAAGDKIKEIGDKAKEEVMKKAQQAREGADELAEWGKKKVNSMVDAAKAKAQELQKKAEQQVNRAGAAVQQEVNAAKKAIGEKAQNVANLWKTIYANAGNWSGEAEHTNFVVVCGRYAVNCTWLSNGDIGDLPTPVKPEDQQALDKIKALLTFPGGTKAPSTIHYEESLKAPLAKSGEMYVFIGDLHVHLFHCSACDNFKHEPAGKKESLAPELVKFIKHAKSSGVATDHIIQVGDRLEVWEVQILMEMACEKYIDLVNKTPRDARMEASCKKFDLNMFKDGPPGRDKARTAFREKCSAALVDDMFGLGSEVPKGIEADFKAKLEYWDSSKVEAAIKGIFKKLYQLDFDADFKSIRGNHDNGVALKNDKLLFGSIGTEDGNAPYDPYKIGEKDCVWYQHGDAMDFFNNRSKFSKTDKGYDKTKGWIHYEVTRALKSPWKATLWETFKYEVGDVAGGGVLAAFAFLLARKFKFGSLPGAAMDEIMGNDSGTPRLIVMGHSHITTLADDWTGYDEGGQALENLGESAKPMAMAIGKKAAET